MKKTTRLTALLVSLVLLLGTLSASATGFAEGIPFGEFDLSSYETMLTDAEAVGLSASQPCGKTNPYCASVSKIAGLTNAKARYDYLASMNSLDAIGVLMHYHDYHEADNTVCLCTYPNFDAAYVPGGLNHDAACPWYFANLTVSEQYELLRKMSDTQRAEYMELLDTEKRKELDAYLNMVDVSPCDPDTCPYVDEYGVDFFSMDSFYLYEYLYNLYDSTKSADGTPSVEVDELIMHLRDYHIAEGVYCQCQSFSFTNNVDMDFGRITHTGSTFGEIYFECPWHFSKLTTAEQAQVLSEIDESQHNAYYATLSADQKAALESFMSGVNKDQATIPSEDSAVTVDISVPADVFGTGVNYVMEAGEAQMTTEKVSALNEVFVGHTLAAFDITFYNLDRPGKKLQPVNGSTIPLTFTVDVSEADGDTMQVYHLYEQNGKYVAEPVGAPIAIDKTSGTQTITIEAKSFSIYVVGVDCDGERCGFNAYIQMSGSEKYAEMVKYVLGTSANEAYPTYSNFTSHINSHIAYDAVAPYCTCADFTTNYANLGYGSLNHGIDSFTGTYCPWHFCQLAVEDQYTVIKDMNEDERKAYTDTLSETQKAALNDYIADQEGAATDLCVVVGNQLMYGDVALANITENGYIIDIATGIAVGRYDRETGEFTMGTGSN